ncbi:hypothetical protein DQ04_00311080 [Trypanosoma grayi]|uniref:hypothetical protein n=1 Tax=Trypanosoma grayi TaxID=71804 RepID=UPI0004F4AD58|nr:hypothetical protein DQ04_00311080 [Trypanosoma grayi]KEG14772.1 hypothetical protein DQ04_00311080 [Trypanosoma grayi]
MGGGGKGKRRPPQSLLSADDAPEGTFAVIDPLSQRLFVPKDSMRDTLAMHRAGVPSLCRLYLQGRCRQGASCYQAHADINVVKHLREIALREPTCCERHGAISDTTCISRNLIIAVAGSNDQEQILKTTLSRVTVTKGLRLLLKQQALDDNSAESTAVVPFGLLCRLHNPGPCRFGHECNFVHLCREVIAQMSEQQKEKETGGRGTCEAPLPTDVSAIIRSPRKTNTKAALVPNEAEIPMGISPLQFFSPRPVLISRPIATGMVSLSGTPKLSTSPVLSRSYNSTSLGIVWRHNPYGVGSSASSVVET